MISRAAIIGVGLIGGSMGLALNLRHLVDEIIGFDTDNDNINLALSAGAIHKAAATIGEAVSKADLVVLATPVLTAEKLICQIAGHLKPNAVVTDVGSTKESITAAAEKTLPQNVFFVGGHPMAGSEVTGMRGADPYLFENAYYLLTPTSKTNPWALQTVRTLVQKIGARVVEMDPQKHDAAVAAVSHLPHLVAAALVNTLDSLPNSSEIIPLTAGGFRDTTRIAAGSPVMWRDIFQANRSQVLNMLNQLRKSLDEYQQLIVDGDAEQLEAKLQQARKTRLSLPKRSKGYLPALFEVLLTVPDKPGVIADFALLLGKNNVNITDLEILRVREGQGGTIRLAFATEDEQLKAVEVLASAGYQAHIC